MNKYLIINADDFGYNEQQTDAITELYKTGLISSTSFLCVTPYSETAAKRAAAEKIPVGVHLAINSDNENEPWRSLSSGASLCNEKGLESNQKRLALHARRSEVAKELEAQYNFLISNGVTVDHADNHCGTLYGINGRRFYLDAYDFCARHALAYRFPKRPDFIARQLGISRVPKPVCALQRYIVSQGQKRNVRLLDDLVSNPWSAKDIKDCDALKKYYLDAVENCCAGVTEMFLHPAKERDDPTGDWKKRVFEYEILKSGDLLQRAKDKNIKIISWADFAAMPAEKLT